MPFQTKEFMIPSRHCAESATYVAPFIPETIGTSVLVHMRGEIVIVTVYILKWWWVSVALKQSTTMRFCTVLCQLSM